MSYKIPRHKVFISYHHELDQEYKNHLIKMSEYNPDKHQIVSIFEDYSVRENDIDDTGMSDEDIRKEIRDNYINDASVLILLCGKETKNRKFIDWELHAAMYNSDEKPKLGILVINLPSINHMNSVHANDNEEKSIVSNNTNWVKYTTRKEYEDNYPFMPSRIIDNFESATKDSTIVPMIVVDWDVVANNNAKLKTLIDKVYNYGRDSKNHYNHSSPLRGRNS